MIERDNLLSEDLPPDYDMIDTDEDLSLYKPLNHALKTVREIILQEYDSSDKSAIRNQRCHRILTVLAAVSGTIAVLFAIMQLSGFFPAPWPMWVEMFAALIALFAVIAGWKQARHKEWLLQRHMAECFRFIKFQALIHPYLWSGSGKMEAWKNKIIEEKNKILNLTHKSLHAHIEDYEPLEIPSEIGGCSINEDTLKSLVDYYRKKRLYVQMSFFNKRVRQYKGIERFAKNIPPMLFFLSVLCVFGHFMIDIFYSRYDLHFLSVLLIVLAASFPVIGAGIRTLRYAHEFSRSASLYQAKYNALLHLDERLDKESGCQGALHILWLCEQFLEGEHCEWLRLMLEAEWFG